jgi:hypothetical protein
MKKIFGLMACASIAALAMGGMAQASWDGTVTANGCPDTTTLTTHGGALNGVATDCNLVITFNSDGSITTSGPGGNYDGSEDALVGVINNSGHTLSAFNISGSGIFSLMEPGPSGDGIGVFIGSTNALDSTWYGGPNAWFTGVTFGSPDIGTVNFAGGIANGHTSFFSLEEPIDLSHPPVISGVPEPATFLLFGVGLAGVAGRFRRKTKKA